MKRLFLFAFVMFFAGFVRAGEPVGKLHGYINKVLLRRTGSSEWLRGRLGQELGRNDTVYTMASSYAEVWFDTGETLSLAPNTLVVLRPPANRVPGAEMLAGEIHSRHSRIMTRNAIIRPKTLDAEFSAVVKMDMTTVVSVTNGVAEVEAQGKKVEVRKGYVSEVRPDMAPSKPVARAALQKYGKMTAAVPAGSAPTAEISAPSASLPANALDAVDATKGYQLQVAKDREFSTVLLDRTYSALDNLNLGRVLPPGEYFIRAAKIDLLDYRGKFSAPRRINIKKGD